MPRLGEFSNWVVEKLNPAQEEISVEEGSEISGKTTFNSAVSFRDIEAVNRGINMLVNSCAELNYDVKDRVTDGVVRISAKKLQKILNFCPNPYQDTMDYRKNMFTDFVFNGTTFNYFDSAHLYHLPSDNTTIEPDKTTFVKGYKYGDKLFSAKEVFHFKDISTNSIYRGSSRLDSIKNAASTIKSQSEYQNNFFNNGAAFGMILTTENSLSPRAKEKTILQWLQRYNYKNGGKRPVIFDNGLKPHAVANSTFKEMDFDVSMKTNSERVLVGLGVPPILLAGGNNANISPNLRLFYLQAVMPIVRSYCSALKRFYGYDIQPVTDNISALQPELKEVASYNSTLVNAGIMTPNESRERLRLGKLDDPEMDKVRVPANIAGSAINPESGGRPPESSDE